MPPRALGRVRAWEGQTAPGIPAPPLSAREAIQGQADAKDGRPAAAAGHSAALRQLSSSCSMPTLG